MRDCGAGGAAAFWLAGLLAVGMVRAAAAEPDETDRTRAEKLFRKSKTGQRVAAADRRFLQETVMSLRGSLEAKPSWGLVPLTEMGVSRYHGVDGGLYGGGVNQPPARHLAAARRALQTIRPVNGDGKPDPAGKVVFLSTGMSNTTQEFRPFKEAADTDPDKTAHVTIVDGAQGGQDGAIWAHPGGARNLRTDAEVPSPWTVVGERLRQAGVTKAQVQVVWMKHALAGAAVSGPFPESARLLTDVLRTIVRRTCTEYPNVKLLYVSSRTYAGLATTPLNPEPWAYESGFAVRWLIEEQIEGGRALNHDPARGRVTAPVLLWGPYLWADGVTPRADGLTWTRDDVADDGTHPADGGRRKFVELMLKFLKSDETARTWFTGRTP